MRLQGDEKLKKMYKHVIKEISDRILGRLENQFIFSGKLRILQVSLSAEKTEATSGLLVREGPGFLMIILKINPSDPLDFIRHVIAHEFYHLLFASIDQIAQSGFSPTDETFQVTAVTRIDSEGKIHGAEFEENLCDFFAYQTNEHFFRSFQEEYSEMYQKFLETKKRSFEMLQTFIDSFVYEEGYFMTFDKLSKHENYECPMNPFLYSITTFSLDNVIRYYDEIMGKNSFLNMISLIEKLCSESEIEDNEIFSSEVMRFRRLS